jgi:mannose-1-phosphate guanylyltransferase
MNQGHTWALVLAAGEGSRLRSLTTDSTGIPVPKQFCSLHGGYSLLHEALQRAEAITDREHICTIVAEQHRRWWDKALQTLPESNVIVQPQNRGTANGILLPLLHILERDPDARVVLLPADHHVRDEGVLAAALQGAVDQLNHLKREIVLLGIAPDEVDPELGYIVPGVEDVRGVPTVEQFLEKPSAALAEVLIRQGALWNAFIVAARGRALLDVFAAKFPGIVADMEAVVAHDSINPRAPIAAAHFYKTLPEIDFSRHVTQGSESILRVVAVPKCGWSDLGTPKRVAHTLGRLPPRWRTYAHEVTQPYRGHLNLAEQHALLQMGV